MTEVAVGIGLSGPLLHAQTLGHEQRGGCNSGGRMIAGMRRYYSDLEYLGGLPVRINLVAGFTPFSLTANGECELPFPTQLRPLLHGRNLTCETVRSEICF